MKNLILSVFAFLLLTFIGCSSDSPTGSGGIGGGGGGTGGVTFTVSLVQDQQQQIYFRFTPSTGVVINTIRGVCQAIQVDETVTDNSGKVYTQNEPADVGPISGLQQGQQWVFTITGKIGSTTGQAYTVTVNYTIP